MTGVDTLRAIIKNQSALADPLTPIDLGRFEWHFSPSDDLPEVSPTDVLSLSHEERIDLVRAATRIYKSRFGKSERCWCAPCAIVKIPGVVLVSLLIEEPLLARGHEKGMYRYKAWEKLSEINWWCFKDFGFLEGPDALSYKEGYDQWIKALAGDSNDQVDDLTKLLEFKEREVAAAKVLLQRLDIDSAQSFLEQASKNQNRQLTMLIERANQGNVSAAAKIAKGLQGNTLLNSKLRWDLNHTIDQCIDFPGFCQFPFNDLLGPFGYEDGPEYPRLKSWINAPTAGTDERPSLIEWMDSQEYHAGLGQLGGLNPSPDEQRAHELLIQEITIVFESFSGASGDEYRFLKGLHSLYKEGCTPSSAITVLREIAERKRGPFASTLSKIYMFGFKVPQDTDEALRWMALSGEIERFAANCSRWDDTSRSWLISAFATHFMSKGNKTDAVAWGNLSASHSIDLEPYGWGTLHACCGPEPTPYLSQSERVQIYPADWPAGKLCSYDILHKLLFSAKDTRDYSPDLDSALLARIFGLPPPSFKGTFSNRDAQYRAAFQFIYRRFMQNKDVCIYMPEGFTEAPVDIAEAFVHVVLLFDVGLDVVKCTKSDDAIAIVMNAAKHAANDAEWDYDGEGEGGGEEDFWWRDRGFLFLVDRVTKDASSEDIQRGIERLKLLFR